MCVCPRCWDRWEYALPDFYLLFWFLNLVQSIDMIFTEIYVLAINIYAPIPNTNVILNASKQCILKWWCAIVPLCSTRGARSFVVPQEDRCDRFPINLFWICLSSWLLRWRGETKFRSLKNLLRYTLNYRYDCAQSYIEYKNSICSITANAYICQVDKF